MAIGYIVKRREYQQDSTEDTSGKVHYRPIFGIVKRKSYRADFFISESKVQGHGEGYKNARHAAEDRSKQLGYVPSCFHAFSYSKNGARTLECVSARTAE